MTTAGKLKLFNKRKQFPLLLFSLLSTTSGCGAEKPNLSEDQPAGQQITQLDSGLQIDDYVVEVFEDSKGNLWFGTMAKGAARYDGKSLTYFSTNEGLCNSTVVSIAEDKAGNIWFGTHDGASRFDGNTFTNFGTAQGLGGAGCNILIDRDGIIWIGTNYGIFRYDETLEPIDVVYFDEFVVANPGIADQSYKWEAGKVWSIMEDRKGNIWFGRDGFGACRYNPSAEVQATAFTHFTKKDGLCSNNVASIVEDDEGNIWFGCLSSDFPEYVDEGGLCRYDGKTFTKFPEVEGLSQNDIYTIYKEKSGNIWIGAVGVGAYRFDGANFTLFEKTDRPDLVTNFGVQAILEDTKGTLWCGFSGGLFRFNGTFFMNVTQDGPWK